MSRVKLKLLQIVKAQWFFRKMQNKAYSRFDDVVIHREGSKPGSWTEEQSSIKRAGFLRRRRGATGGSASTDARPTRRVDLVAQSKYWSIAGGPRVTFSVYLENFSGVDGVVKCICWSKWIALLTLAMECNSFVVLNNRKTILESLSMYFVWNLI